MFSGIGGFEVGLINSDYDFEFVGYSEIDKYASSIYEHHFPEHKNYGDATLINTEELPDFDLLVGGFPCFTGDTLVYTDKGSIPISEISIGDKVLTHKDNYHNVVNVMVKPYHSNGLRITVEDEEDNISSVVCTSDHPFYSFEYFIREHSFQTKQRYDRKRIRDEVRHDNLKEQVEFYNNELNKYNIELIYIAP